MIYCTSYLFCFAHKLCVTSMTWPGRKVSVQRVAQLLRVYRGPWSGNSRSGCGWHRSHMGVFIVRRAIQMAGCFHGKSEKNMDDLGVPPLLRKPPRLQWSLAFTTDRQKPSISWGLAPFYRHSEDMMFRFGGFLPRVISHFMTRSCQIFHA